MKSASFASPTISDLLDEAQLGEGLAALVQAGLEQRGRLRLCLRGDSMWPTIPAGSTVEVEQVRPTGIRLGDVVVWQHGAQLVAHRVVRKIGDGPETRLLTKGDNSAASDRELLAGEVLCRVVEVSRADGSSRSGLGSRETGFWLARWRFRSALGRIGRILPAGVRVRLLSLRDRLGYLLSVGYEGLWLRD